MQINLTARPPFSLPSLMQSHGWLQLAPFSYAPGNDHFSTVHQLRNGRVLAMTVQPTHTGVRLTTDTTLDETESQELAHTLEGMLALGQDFSDFYNLAEGEPKLANVRKNADGRILRCPSVFEDTVKTILTTNTSWTGTIRMVRALVDHFGAPLPQDPTQHAFPTPERLAVTDEATLRNQVRLGYRSPYVLALAKAVANRELDLESLRDIELPTQELRQRLLTIKGIGAYAAANLMVLLGRYDFVPVDSWARMLVSREWHHGAPIGATEVERAFERFGKWAALAYWFWDWEYNHVASEGTP